MEGKLTNIILLRLEKTDQSSKFHEYWLENGRVFCEVRVDVKQIGLLLNISSVM